MVKRLSNNYTVCYWQELIINHPLYQYLLKNVILFLKSQLNIIHKTKRGDVCKIFREFTINDLNNFSKSLGKSGL